MDIGTIEHVDIDAQMRAAYLDYAMSVIVSRALPDARRRTIEGQTHDVDPVLLAPVLGEFFAG